VIVASAAPTPSDSLYDSRATRSEARALQRMNGCSEEVHIQHVRGFCPSALMPLTRAMRAAICDDGNRQIGRKLQDVTEAG